MDTFGFQGKKGCIGLLGPKCFCASCGSKYIKWNSISDVTSCQNCGWNNNDAAKANRQKRIKNGEI